MTKVTVNLVPAAMDALGRAAEYEELSKTDVINRAIQLYAALVTAKPGGQVSITTPVGDVLRLIIPAVSR
jgi:hypothetical protein